jgi:hypothetical protein
VEVLDGRVDRDLCARLEAIGEDLLFVGASVMGGYFSYDAYAFCVKAKQRFPHVPVVWGGWHATLEPDLCLEFPCVDVLARGQGEDLAPEIATRIQRQIPLDDLAGVSLRRGGRVIHNPAPAVKDPNEFPPLDYEVLDLSKYALGGGLLHYLSSMGCPRHCTFCGTAPYYRGKWYGLRAERVVEEWSALWKKYGFSEMDLADANFFGDGERVKGILRGVLRENLTFAWTARCDPHTLIAADDEMYDLLRATCCKCLRIGLESGSRRMRRKFGKDFEDDELARVVERLATAGVEVEATYIKDAPGESEEDFRRTIRSMAAVRKASPKNRASLLTFVPAPWTPLGKKAAEEATVFWPRTPADLRALGNLAPSTHRSPWSKGATARRRRMVMFYFKMAFINTRKNRGILAIPARAIKGLAALRLDREIFLFPLEWYIFRLLSFVRFPRRGASPHTVGADEDL